MRTNQTHILVIKHLNIVAMQGQSWSVQILEGVFILPVDMMTFIVIGFFLLNGVEVASRVYSMESVSHPPPLAALCC